MGRIQKIQRKQTVGNIFIHKILTVLMILPIVLSGCTTYKAVRPETGNVSLMSLDQDFPEQELLDVRIQVFDPGTLPSSIDEARGLSEEIRKAEAHYIPTEIKKAMQQTGHWGAVRVVPAGASGDEVQVFGRILKSTGEELLLEIYAKDATGKEWFKRKVFRGAVDIKRYTKANRNRADAFQNLYNRIANELARYRVGMSSKQVDQIRQTAELKFAEELAPSAFKGYLKNEGRNGMVRIDRLPPENDEMLQRVNRIRERNYMLVDTLDEHYEGLHKDMNEIYTEWRKSRLTEINIIREIDRRKNAKLMQGGAVLAGTTMLSILMGRSQNSNAAVSAAAISAATLVTTQLLFEADKIKKEAEINKAAMEELGDSFETDIEPTIVKVEGKVVQLNGSAQAKYEQWREVMKKITEEETGGVFDSAEPVSIH